MMTGRVPVLWAKVNPQNTSTNHTTNKTPATDWVAWITSALSLRVFMAVPPARWRPKPLTAGRSGDRWCPGSTDRPR